MSPITTATKMVVLMIRFNVEFIRLGTRIKFETYQPLRNEKHEPGFSNPAGVWGDHTTRYTPR